MLTKRKSLFFSAAGIFRDATSACTKRRLFEMFMLNVSDWICTMSLLSTGYFSEANPIMRKIIESPLLGFTVKVALPLCLIVPATRKLGDASRGQLLISNNIALFGCAVYFLLNLYHIFCFCLLYAVMWGAWL